MVYNIRSSVRTHAHMCMHLYPCEFAFVYMHKCKRSFLRAFACVRLRAYLRTELIKTQNAFVRKIFQQQTHFGFRNFQDVLYIASCAGFVFIRRWLQLTRKYEIAFIVRWLQSTRKQSRFVTLEQLVTLAMCCVI